MKMTALFFSKSGNTQAMAEAVAAGMAQVPGVEAKALSIGETGEDFENWVKESRCVVLGSPVYVASVAAEVKVWLDGPARKLGLAGKLGGAFATARYIHGGGDLAIRLILDHMMTFGMVTYSGGGACGLPVIHLGPVAIGGHLEDFRAVFETWGNRMAAKARELFEKEAQ